MAKAIAVLISDVHYSLQTLSLADASMRQAIHKANALNVPLIVAGDLHDTKANLRGECVNAMIETFKLCELPPYVLVGNHDRIHEKSEAHSLNFLSPRVIVVNGCHNLHGRFSLLAYQHDPKEYRWYLQNRVTEKLLICHQGLKGGSMGDYIQDHSAVDVGDVKDFRVISGHYHTRQDIKTGRPQQGALGLWSYIGNPFTVSYGEANDPEKGFQVLYDNGLLEFLPTNLRKHVVVNCTAQNYKTKIIAAQADDLLWIKMTGTVNDTVSRREVTEWLGRDVFKLTFDTQRTEASVNIKSNQTQEQLLDSMLDKLPNSDRLKSFWRGLCE